MQENLFLEETTNSPASSPTSEIANKVEVGPAVELKGSVFTLPILRFKRSDPAGIQQALEARLCQSQSFFENAPVVLDLELLEAGESLDFIELCKLLRSLQLVPVGVRQASEEHQKPAVEAGLALLKGGAIQEPAASESKDKQTGEVIKHVQVPAKACIIEQPVRSGQQIYAQGGDLIVLAQVNAGAEVIADGNIHIYAPLRGRALAGVLGDTSARIIAQSMEAELVSIAGHYQIFEEQPSADVFGKPAQAFLKEMKMVLAPLHQ